MSMSIYYTAKRDYPMNSNENKAIQSIVNRYCSEYPFENKYEDFCLYNELNKEQDIILDGATSIPISDDNYYDIILYWLKCLTEITRFLPKCDWEVHFDDIDLIWESQNGWCLPTD